MRNGHLEDAGGGCLQLYIRRRECGETRQDIVLVRTELGCEIQAHPFSLFHVMEEPQ